MENLKKKIEEILETKIIKISVSHEEDNKDDEYQISITFNGNIKELRSLFDFDYYDDINPNHLT